jgi:Flp pilus assembly protein TadD
MGQRLPMRSRLAAACVAALVGAAAPAWATSADEFREAQKLYDQGKVQPALERVDAFLGAQPKDPQGRFLRGLLLAELKRTPEAIEVFTGLTEEFPELPEPYNNLAVLYASQGNYERAKSALELAIHTHPTYATAHENLGDVYAQLASRAYERALQLDAANPAVRNKRAVIRGLLDTETPLRRNLP